MNDPFKSKRDIMGPIVLGEDPDGNYWPIQIDRNGFARLSPETEQKLDRIIKLLSIEKAKT